MDPTKIITSWLFLDPSESPIGRTELSTTIPAAGWPGGRLIPVSLSEYITVVATTYHRNADMSIHPADQVQTESAHGLSNDEKTDCKGDAYATSVHPVSDLESAGYPIKGDVIPEGVDPNIMRVEQVHRGLKQRHIQVSQAMEYS